MPFPSEERLGLLCGYHEDTVGRLIRSLEHKGVLRIVRTPNRANRYDLSRVHSLCEAMRNRELDAVGEELDPIEDRPLPDPTSPMDPIDDRPNRPTNKPTKENNVCPAGASDTRDSSSKVEKEKQKPSKAKLLPMPSTFSPNEEDLGLAASLTGLNEPDQRIRFVEHYKAQPKRSADWNASYRQWLRRAYDFAIKNGQIEKPKGPIVIDDTPGQRAFDARERVRKAEIATRRAQEQAAFMAKHGLKKTGDKDADERAFKAAIDMEVRMIGQVG